MGVIKSGVERVRRVFLFFKLLSLAIYAIYIIYNIVTVGTYVKLKIALLVITAVYALIYIILHKKSGGAARRARNGIGRLYRGGKVLINGINVFLIIDGIINAASRPTLWSVLLAIGMLLSWFVSFITEMVLSSVSRKIDFITGSVERPIERLFKENKK